MGNYKVYVHQNLINDKRYIGITSKLPSQRWANGKGYAQNQHFTNAIKKYGWENFRHYIIAYDISEEEAYQLEIGLIALWHTTNPKYGYNLSRGGEHVNKKHGLSGHKLYSRYSRARLLVGMCPEWDDFGVFYQWCQNNGYKDGYVLVRYDETRPHSPYNSVWVPFCDKTKFRQNYRRMLTYKGETHTVQEWADIIGIGKSTILHRLNGCHWSVEDALTIIPYHRPEEDKYLRKHGLGYRVDLKDKDGVRRISHVYRDIEEARKVRDEMVQKYK